MEAKIAIGIVAILAAFGGGFWLADTLAEKESFSAQNTAMASAINESERLRGQLASVDKKHTEEMTNARIENDKLRADLSAGAKRVSVAVRSCKATTTASVDDATSSAELDPKVAADLAGIAADGDAAIRQLTALQEWTKTVTGSTSEGVIQSQAAGTSGR